MRITKYLELSSKSVEYRKELREKYGRLKELYDDLERQFFDLDRVIPRDRKCNATAFSPRMSNMILQGGPCAESLARIICERCKITQTDNMPAMMDWINSDGILEHIPIIDTNSRKKYAPFRKNNNGKFAWWDAYNNIKHNLLESEDMVNYGTLTDLCAALSVLFRIAGEVISHGTRALCRSNWTTTRNIGYDPGKILVVRGYPSVGEIFVIRMNCWLC